MLSQAPSGVFRLRSTQMIIDLVIMHIYHDILLEVWPRLVEVLSENFSELGVTQQKRASAQLLS